jgi:hypothetical protein
MFAIVKGGTPGHAIRVPSWFRMAFITMSETALGAGIATFDSIEWGE